MPMHRRRLRLAASAVCLAGLVAACGGTTDPSAAPGGGGGGSIVVDGSSTVEPITTAVAEEFRAERPGVQVTVGTSGTGGGFKRFCAGETDISNASRAIKDEEKQACAANGVTFTEFRVGLDGLAIVTSKRNDFLECLDFEQLATVFKEGGAKTWNEVDPSFPEERIAIFAPGTDSGTFDFFVEEVLGDPKKPDSIRPRTDYQASEDDNTIVQGVEGERTSFGFFGFAYFEENAEALKAVHIAEEPDGECIEPTAATVESGDYPLSRPLFIYLKNQSLQRSEVEAFVRFYLEVAPDLVGEVGYIKAPDADYERGLETLDRVTGS